MGFVIEVLSQGKERPEPAHLELLNGRHLPMLKVLALLIDHFDEASDLLPMNLHQMRAVTPKNRTSTGGRLPDVDVITSPPRVTHNPNTPISKRSAPPRSAKSSRGSVLALLQPDTHGLRHMRGHFQGSQSRHAVVAAGLYTRSSCTRRRRRRRASSLERSHSHPKFDVRSDGGGPALYISGL
ncbi:hypothetical protein Mapa_010769 [Marchantia paleacea]|nr:hypothetical protein Mapa_010769 [Marchantia paleacea]